MASDLGLYGVLIFRENIVIPYILRATDNFLGIFGYFTPQNLINWVKSYFLNFGFE